MIKNIILITSLFVCACSHTRPVDSVPTISSTINDKVDCVNAKEECLKQSADICAHHGFNGFIIERETSGTITIDEGTPERGWRIEMQCVNCIDTKRTCYTTYK